MWAFLKRWFEFLLQKGPLTIAVTYLVIGLFWIFYSDRIAYTVAGRESQFLIFSIFKGFAFVIVTAVLLYAMIHFYFRKTAEAHERYRALTENSPDMIFHLSLPDGRFRYVSPAALGITGYTPGELVGDPGIFTKIVHPSWQEKVLQIRLQLLAAEVPPAYEYQIIHKSGEIRWVNQRNTLIRDNAGKPVAIEGTVMDITARKKAEEQISLANRKLALMTDVTYQDIQNKVTALRGFVQLSHAPASEEERTFFINKETEVLETIHNLINKTKDYQQMGMDQSRWIPLEKTIPRQWSILSQKNNVVLDCNLPGLEICADPLIDRVFFNLLDNAVAHGQTITRISFDCRETTEGLVLVCEDDGIGIPREEKLRIFNREVGEGKFGLFFVREFLSLFGMSITENGVPGKGARFEITLPAGVYRFADRQ
jgi:PAS domain S-box-containing protein